MVALELGILVVAVIAIPGTDKLSINGHDIGKSFGYQWHPVSSSTILDYSEVERGVVDEDFLRSDRAKDFRIDLAEAGSKLDDVVGNAVNCGRLGFNGFGGTDEGIENSFALTVEDGYLADFWVFESGGFRV